MEYDSFNWSELEEEVGAIFAQSDSIVFAALEKILESVRSQNESE